MTMETTTNPVSATSRWMAAARARETRRRDRLFCDPLAAELAGPEGFAWLDRTDPPGSLGGPGAYAVIRTRFFDDFLQSVCQSSEVRQVVLVAAGMDTRAFRLDWPPGTCLYELDLPEVLAAKEEVTDKAGVRAGCKRLTVGVDLKEEGWPETLLDCGYRPERPSVWLIEGLLFYLTRSTVHGLLEKVGALTTAGSLLGLDVMNRDVFFSPVAWPIQATLAWSGAPGRFGTDEPEALLSGHGWKAAVTQPGEEGAKFGRWPGLVVPREVPGIPRGFLVKAHRP